MYSLMVSIIPLGKRRMDNDDAIETEFARDTPNQCDGIVLNIDKIFNELASPPSSELCIYRVPKKLRKVNEEAYTPHVVSIGPFHHGNEKLKSMELVKKIYFKKFVRRNSANISLKSYVEFVKEQEGRIRQCYSEHIDPKESGEFVTMILIDSCFIIEVLLISYYTKWKDDDHSSVFSVPWVFSNIVVDLMLLENQVPFFVLEGLFRLATDASFGACSLLDLSLNFFADSNIQQKNRNDIQSVKHFTDLILTLYRPPAKSRPPPGNERFISIFNCTELNESGVTFKASKSKCLFDISFTNDVLEIPNCLLDDNTETLFRNLMALELCHYPDNSCVTDYIVFMDCLVNTTRDVDLLVRKEIINNCLGDNKAAADLFNSLCINVVVDDFNFYFSKVSEDLNAFYKVPWHKSMAMLKHDYFKTRWRAASTFAAITLLVLTLIQTVCTVISTVRSN